MPTPSQFRAVPGRKRPDRSTVVTVPDSVPVPSVYQVNRQPSFIRGISRKSNRGTFRSAGSTVIAPSTTPGSLTLWFTGAASNGAAQSSQALSLGNYRSSTEAERVGVLYDSAIPGLTVLMASRDNIASEIGILSASGGSVKYVLQDGTAGSATICANGQTVTLNDTDNPAAWIRVYRNLTTNPFGSAVLKFHDQFNNVFAQSDAAEAQQAAGGSRYRAVMALSGVDATDVKFWIKTMAMQAISSVAFLSGAGAGTIQGAADCFVDWDQQGWANVRNSSGTLREIVYYSSRTDSILTVPALGRGRLGTAAAAGTSGDLIDSVGPYRIAWEDAAPLAGGPIQTIANESSAPAGVSWSTGVTALTGVGPTGTFAAGTQGGLWLHRELPAGVSGFSRHQCRIAYSFTAGGTVYTGTLAGLFRIADNDAERYELHVGVGSLPDLSAAPNETFASLPYTTTLTLGSSTTNFVVINRRNKYNLVTESRSATVFTIDGSGNEVQPAPTAPERISWRAGATGTFTLDAIYVASLDGAYPADFWAIYIRTDGTDPDPGIDVPTLVALAPDGNGIAYLLAYQTGAFADGTVGKVLLRVKRSSDTAFSDNTDIYFATAVVAGAMTTPTGRPFFAGVAEANQ